MNMNFAPTNEKHKMPLVIGAALATGALFMTGCNSEAHGNTYAYCTGSQEVEADAGTTLQGLIEAHVETPSEDGLKSATENGGSGLDILAQGITNDYNGESVTVPLNYPEAAAQVNVQAGETYLLPEQCEAPDVSE